MREIAVGSPLRWIEKRFLCAVLILMLSFAAFLNSLNGEFVWDDTAQVEENPFIRDLRNLPLFFTADIARYTASPESSPYYRPLFLISYAIDYSIWGVNPFGFHLTNITLHALCSLLFYVTLLRFLENRAEAFIAAAIFAVHPIHAEAVAWIAGRADLLAALFVFASFYFYVRFRDTGRKLFIGASLLASALSLLSKEAAIVTPLLIMAYEYVCRQEAPGPVTTRTLFGSAPFFLIVGLYLLLRILVMGTIVLKHPSAPPVTIGTIYTKIVIVFEYLRLFLFPLNLKVYYHFPINDFPSPLYILVSSLGLGLLVAVQVRAHGRDRRLFFGSLWFLIALLPALGSVGPVFMADRYLYIPSFGLCLVAGLLLARLNQIGISAGYRLLMSALLLVALLLLALQQNTIWRDEYTYFKRGIEDAPRFAIARNNLGKWYLDRKMPNEAVRLFQDALALNPDYSTAQINLGAAYSEMGLHEKAIAEYQEAIQKNPAFAALYYNLGNAYREMGAVEKAVAQWKRVIAIEPGHSLANNNLGNVYLLQGDYRRAAERYAIALRSQPLNPEAHYNLAVALEKEGDLKAAIPHYEKFARLAPSEYRDVVEQTKLKLERLREATK